MHTFVLLIKRGTGTVGLRIKGTEATVVEGVLKIFDDEHNLIAGAPLSEVIYWHRKGVEV